MNDLRDRRILIAGAAGAVGANLVRELIRRGAEVHALVRPSTKLWRIEEVLPRLTLHQTDLTRREELQGIVTQIRPEVVFNLAVRRASLSPRDRWETLQTNIVGTAALLEATAPLDDLRFFQLGSSTEYGVRDRPLQETDCLEPGLYFGATKAAATLLCQQFARAHSRPVVVLRLFMVYGYWESPKRLIPTAVMAALRGEEMALTAPGYRRDWVFIEDVVEACLLALQAEGVAGEVINVGSGQQWSNEEVVAMVQAVSGRRIGVRIGEYPARPSDTANWVADIRKAERLLGWQPRHSLRSGLEKTLSWFRHHQEAYVDPSLEPRG
jgi:nucleoside-diphosphate-sugar epimerase